MAAKHDHIRDLIDKLEGLSPERIAEVEDFVDFLKARDQDRQLTEAAARIAEERFLDAWDNPDDAAYDRL